MKQYNILHPLYMAFYSKLLYRDVSRHWKGAGILYLLWLVVIVCIPWALQAHVAITKFITEAQPIVAQLPTITLNKGEVSIDQPEPYFIRDPNSQKVLAIIDTSGQFTSLDNAALVLLTRDKLFVKDRANLTKVYDLSQTKDAVYTSENVGEFLKKIGHNAIFFLYPFALALFFFQGIFETLFYAWLAKIFTHTKLPYQTLCRLTVIAITPAFILDAIMNLLNVSFPYSWLAFFLLSMVYLFYGIEANKEEINQPPAEM